MGDFKGTKGKWSYSPQDGTIGHCEMAQVWGPDGHNLAEIEPTNPELEASANALLISKAPEMLEMLEKCERTLREIYMCHTEELRKLIKDATDIRSVKTRIEAVEGKEAKNG